MEWFNLKDDAFQKESPLRLNVQRPWWFLGVLYFPNRIFIILFLEESWRGTILLRSTKFLLSHSNKRNTICTYSIRNAKSEESQTLHCLLLIPITYKDLQSIMDAKCPISQPFQNKNCQLPEPSQKPKVNLQLCGGVFSCQNIIANPSVKHSFDQHQGRWVLQRCRKVAAQVIKPA